MDRVFLDANVLFSAVYLPNAGILQLWSLPGVELLTSEFALEEARRNLLMHCPDAIPALDELCLRITVVRSASRQMPPVEGSGLPDKDAPILAAAVASGCTHLLTGDKRHFGPLFGRDIGGVRVLTPAKYLRRPPQR